ncbi:MAG: hypothetical protein CVV31_04850 [Methanomicrobiales archaeon HGW-Methanomicrobiales-2]|jgi:hypothetical protein|nr:MAG: hypothetical protein CVV31_04850 [Methanomicrobiales archaeon HGW-Methanomicrobiales-2]
MMSENYTAKVNILDGDGKRVGTVSLQSPTIAAFEANRLNAGMVMRSLPGQLAGSRRIFQESIRQVLDQDLK